MWSTRSPYLSLAQCFELVISYKKATRKLQAFHSQGNKSKKHCTFSQQLKLQCTLLNHLHSARDWAMFLMFSTNNPSLFWAISLVFKSENCFLCFWAYISKLDKLQILSTAFANSFSPYFDQQANFLKFAGEQNSVTDQ